MIIIKGLLYESEIFNKRIDEISPYWGALPLVMNNIGNITTDNNLISAKRIKNPPHDLVLDVSRYLRNINIHTDSFTADRISCAIVGIAIIFPGVVEKETLVKDIKNAYENNEFKKLLNCVKGITPQELKVAVQFITDTKSLKKYKYELRSYLF